MNNNIESPTAQEPNTINPAKNSSSFLVVSTAIGVITILVLAVSYYYGLFGS